MMGNFTSGPWTAERDPCHFDTLSSIRAGDGALCIEVGGKAGIAEQEANTLLAAAAPNLLDAAQGVVDRWDSPAWKDQRPTAYAIDALRNAIAKATGK